MHLLRTPIRTTEQTRAGQEDRKIKRKYSRQDQSNRDYRANDFRYRVLKGLNELFEQSDPAEVLVT